MKIIWRENEKEDKIYVRDEEHFLGQGIPNEITVHFGMIEKKLSVSFDETLPNDTISLPLNLNEDFTIPKNIPYEVRLERDQVYIGPVIMIIATVREKNLTVKKLNSYLKRFKEYKQIKGLIYLCAATMINKNVKTVTGYYYNPNNLYTPWKKGKFPYPDAVFNKVLLTRTYRHLMTYTNNRVFNSVKVNKWKFWGSLSDQPDTRKVLPYTQRLISLTKLDRMLSKYGTLYLKPIGSSRGRGIMSVEKLNNQYHVKKRNQQNVTKYNKQEMITLIKKIKNKKYIVQQAVPFLFNNKKADLRVFMQKDESLKWKVSGYVVRIAKKGSIVTNLAFVEKLMNGPEGLKYVYQLSENEAIELETKIKDTCIKIGNTIDKKNGNNGDVAIDIIVDNNLNLWILEMQQIYAFKSLKIIENKELYHKVMTTPLKYAKALAGFSSSPNENKN